MRHWLSAIGATCALASASFTQPPSAGSNSMPGGQIVSRGYNLKAAGSRVPSAAPQAGNTIGSPLMRPYDPARPLDALKGSNIDPKRVVAPVTGFPGTQQPDLFDKLYGKLNSVTAFLRPTAPVKSTPTVTPGIFRRNRERHSMQQNWRRD